MSVLYPYICARRGINKIIWILTSEISVATKTVSISRKSTEELSANISPVVLATELGNGTACLVQKDGQVRIFELREQVLEVRP
jgi:hypothetical protein